MNKSVSQAELKKKRVRRKRNELTRPFACAEPGCGRSYATRVCVRLLVCAWALLTRVVWARACANRLVG